MQPSKRSRMDIYAEILEALKRKGLTRITRVSYAVGLPVDRTKNYLKDLSVSGLVGVQTGEDAGYSITHRGLEFLDAYWKLKGFLDFIGEEKEDTDQQSDLVSSAARLG
ncbi:MAG TPA: winged helix-turn-helix domain-containing protein [Candidatus Bathyarchaeia archaeon]|nr:winged helix-turn-helix domain-containing protein [Candidatus Bathyarchaeia archaeon]